MNHCVIQQQNVVVVSSREEINGRYHPVVCPKPRRLGLLNVAVNDHPVRSFRCHLSCQSEICDSKSTSDPLDLILSKGGCGFIEQTCTQMASSPPFFCGSPPSRVENPLIQDARFGDEKFYPLSPPPRVPAPAVVATATAQASSPASSSRKGGCVRANFGNNPAVRIEGFDCLDRDRRNCSIPALA